MRKTSFPRLMALLGITGAFVAAPAIVQAQVYNEPPVAVDSSPRYEKDAWYDVSEWFDMNDFNPTDEAIGRWDDEYYDYTDDLTDDDETVAQSAVDYAESLYNGGYTGYGYFDKNANSADQWTYDYYDDRYHEYYNADDDDNYEYYVDYVDTDADGVYEYYVGYVDTDADGYYDKKMEKQWFSGSQQDNASDNQQASSKTDQADKKWMRRSSHVTTVSGQVQAVKVVQTPSGKRLVAQLPSQKQGQQLIAVDLGPVGVVTGAIGKEVAKGSQLKASGPIATIGEKNVLLAKRVTMDGKLIPIHRYYREYTGTMLNAKTANLRGKQHQVVTMETEDNKRLTVDLGPVDQLQKFQDQLKPGELIRVGGPAVKVKDRSLLVARQFSINGEVYEIRPDLDRRGMQTVQPAPQTQNRNQ